MRGIAIYLFEPFHTFMLGWSNDDEAFEIHLGIGAIVFLKYGEGDE